MYPSTLIPAAYHRYHLIRDIVADLVHRITRGFAPGKSRLVLMCLYVYAYDGPWFGYMNADKSVCNATVIIMIPL